MKARFRIGCSGWYYRDWKGVIYPPELPSTRWFAHYQLTHDTVELNSPFYHWPRPTTVQKWVRQAVPGFKYTIKANRMITHLKRFNDTQELAPWVKKIRASRAKEVWAYFNNDFQGCAFRNAETLKRMLA